VSQSLVRNHLGRAWPVEFVVKVNAERIGGDVPQEHGDDLRHRLQKAIEHIRGINAAQVVVVKDGEIEEIHLVGSLSRLPKPIVRDVESLLKAKFGVHVDYRRISLVQVDENSQAPQKRLQFVSAQACPLPHASVCVVLQDHDQSYEGIAPLVLAESASDAAVQATATATLSALQQTLAPHIHLAVRAALLITAQAHKIVLVLIQAIASGGEEHLTGSCIVADNLHAAAAKATLDAVNRRLAVWAAIENAEPA
jgi:hypothetical protein